VERKQGRNNFRQFSKIQNKPKKTQKLKSMPGYALSTNGGGEF
jgi:hypothetical protein